MANNVYSKARVPVIPLQYSQRQLALKKELLVDYENGKLYIVSATDKNILHDITAKITELVTANITSGTNLTVDIQGVGIVKLGEYLKVLTEKNIDFLNKDTVNYNNFCNTNVSYTEFVGNVTPTTPLPSEPGIICYQINSTIYTINLIDNYGNIVKHNISNAKIIRLNADSERLSILSPKENILYCVKNTSTVYKYLNKKWILVNTVNEIVDIIEAYSVMVPATIENEGVRYAPRTLTTSVFTKSGETLETVIDRISRAMVVTKYVTATSNMQKVFTIPFPIDNYMENGNYIMVFKSSILLDPKRYTISGNKLTLVTDETGVELNKSLVFTFFFNTYINPNPNFNIDGYIISDSSISTKKLSNVVDDYTNNQEGNLPSSKAVSNLYNDLRQRIDTVAPNLIIHANSTGTSTVLNVARTGYTLLDGSIVYLKLHVNMSANANITINGGTQYPIYTDQVTRVKDNQCLKDAVVYLIFNKTENRFYIFGGINYRLKRRTVVIDALEYIWKDPVTVFSSIATTYPNATIGWTVKVTSTNKIYRYSEGQDELGNAIISWIEITDLDSRTSFGISGGSDSFNPVSEVLNVYHNNLRVFEGINYDIINGMVVFRYQVPAEDQIIMEAISIDRIMG